MHEKNTDKVLHKRTRTLQILWKNLQDIIFFGFVCKEINGIHMGMKKNSFETTDILKKSE